MTDAATTSRHRAATAAPVVWMFSGQGSQYFHMGRGLYEAHPVFRACMHRLDAVASTYVGQSVVEALYDPARAASHPFGEILLSHPALFMVQVALAETLAAEGFPEPDLLFGASLGEFVAAAVAGVATPEALLFDLVAQARLFDAHCTGGGMLVVVDALPGDGRHPVFGPGVELAGRNFDRCFTVAGHRAALEAAAARLAAAGTPHQWLPVDVGFHSSQVEALQPLFLRAFSGRAPRPARIPILSCAPGAMPERFTADYWWQVVRRPIEIQQALQQLRAEHPGAICIDLGPSGTLAGFARYNAASEAHSRILPILTPFGGGPEKIAEARERLAALQSTEPLPA